MVRMWQGHDQEDKPVVALVTAVVFSGDAAATVSEFNLVSIPPPTPEDAQRGEDHRDQVKCQRSNVGPDCQDCGVHVFQFGIDTAPSPPRCACCDVIHSISSVADRNALRVALYDPEAMHFWLAEGCYRDEDFAERHCDGCRRLYRGPGVYCSRACVAADA